MILYEVYISLDLKNHALSSCTFHVQGDMQQPNIVLGLTHPKLSVVYSVQYMVGVSDARKNQVLMKKSPKYAIPRPVIKFSGWWQFKSKSSNPRHPRRKGERQGKKI